MISIIFSILSGVTIVLSRSVNGMLSKKMGAYQGTFYNYFTGFMTSLILMLVLMIVGVQHINISLDNEAGILNLKLDKFANIELKLKNATQNIDESLKEFVNELSTSSFIQIKEVPNGYLISSFIGSKKGSQKITAFCEDIDFNIEFYDYSKIKISEDENIDNYRVRLGVKQVRNLLSKHALLGDENLNDIEKELIKYAMLIAILNSAQDDETYDMESICSIYDLFLKYDNNYEKIEFLEQALKATESYAGKIQEIDEIKNIIESKDRHKAGKTLPAHGLYLMNVNYKN